MPAMPGTFRSRHAPTKVEQAKEYEQYRGSARARGYTTRWDKASKSYLSRRMVCPACEKAGVLASSAVTDHIVPHKGDMALFWDRSNWQPCCRWHHDVVRRGCVDRYVG